MIAILLFFSFLSSANSQIDCSKAPDKGIQNICYQIQQMDKDSRKYPRKFFAGRDFTGSVSTVFDCMDLQCICTFILNCGNNWTKSYRKEYRQLTDEERRRYHAAMWGIKANGDYLALSSIHADMRQSPGAHAGPSFLPWHREYIKRIEIALRKFDPLMPGLPYWDSVLDDRLPDPTTSVLWNDELMGSTDSNGFVTSGAFANWTINDGSRVFMRNLGESYSPFSDMDLARIAALRNITYFLAYTAPKANCTAQATWDAPEFEHGKPHSWVGGDMFLTRTSTYDPIFFQHHSFVDLIWENWRSANQNRNSQQTDYPPDDLNCTSAVHFSNSQMLPFNKLNSDGLSNLYFDNLVSYAPRPNCRTSSSECQSRFLFCDLSHGSARCSSKVIIGGNCSGYTRGEDICYNGVCVNGICQISAPTTTTQSTTTATISSVPNSSDCLNRNYCCDYWNSINQCSTNPGYMLLNCKVSCGVCTPSFDPTIACNDRVSDCSTRIATTDCFNPFMAENCRQFCGWCPSFTRQQQCIAGFTGMPTIFVSIQKPKVVPTQGANSLTQNFKPIEDPDCLNHHICCIGWAQFGYCTNRGFRRFMETFCAPSCNLCGSKKAHSLWNSNRQCVDFLSDCRTKAKDDGCSKHKVFMAENCKTTCRTCDLLNERNRLKECQLDRGSQFRRLFRTKKLYLHPLES